MTIPKSPAEVIFRFAITAVVVFFVLLAMVNFCRGLAFIASSLWLSLVALLIWDESRREGGFGGFLISQMGELFGRRFASLLPEDTQPGHLCFGFDLLGQRFIRQHFPLNSIECVEWSTGQASGNAGRDMNDWQVKIWFNPHDPATTESQKQLADRPPRQKLHCVGSSTRKEQTEALGLALVDFLRDAGVNLVPADVTACFVRGAPP